MASPRIVSLNVGQPVATAHSDVGETGIDKHPVDVVRVRAPGPRPGGHGSGVVGDHVADRRHHGGDSKAVYAFAREELDHWAAVLGKELAAGTFGENLTTAGLDVEGAEIGQRWQVGATVVLRVSCPRTPCKTFAGHLGERGWLKRFAERGRTGAYLAVETPGEIRTGDPVVVLDTPGHGIDVRQAFRAFMGDLGLARALLQTGSLIPEGRAELAAVVARRERTSA